MILYANRIIKIPLFPKGLLWRKGDIGRCTPTTCCQKLLTVPEIKRLCKKEDEFVIPDLVGNDKFFLFLHFYTAS